MAILDARTWLEHLSVATCWDLLGEHQVGRLGVLVDSAPEVFPVNYAVDGTTIVFRTDQGGKLRGLDRSPAVCFELDGIDEAAHTGWSVLVKGRSRVVTDSSELHRLQSLPLEFWGAGPKLRWVRIDPTEVTGRRLLPPRSGRP